jgi:hypothetical protein
MCVIACANCYGEIFTEVTHYVRRSINFHFKKKYQNSKRILLFIRLSKACSEDCPNVDAKLFEIGII